MSLNQTKNTNTFIFFKVRYKISNARLIDRTRPDGKNFPHIWRGDELGFITSQPKEMCFAKKFDARVAPNVIRGNLSTLQ